MDNRKIQKAFVYHILPTLVSRGDLVIGHVINSLEDMMILNDGDGEMLKYDERLVKLVCDTDVSISAKAARSCSAALLTDAASAAFSGKMEFGRNSQYSNSLFIRELQGQHVDFTPSAYRKAVECSPEVQKRLSCFSGYAYMVTGLKYCDEKCIAIHRGHETTKVQGQLGLQGGPLSAGARVEGARATTSSLQMTRTADLILAIRVTKLTYKRKYVVAGEKRLVAKGHRHRAELVGKEDAILKKADDFDIEIEEDSGEGDGDEALLGDGSTVKWMVQGTAEL
ncbi:hypothetical protein A9K55_003542 [Cordyceps militaris]|uniref:Uncharacterized protein n=1 Tax=Cordyceps militaris TaxID=73501 RepID=A0A2H4S8V0_CORMI|nr:hypothetical protein A9K55_003542 [Cordyceps militaris]